jgi:hypothetical protein
MQRSYSRLLQFESVAITVGGVVLLVEIGRAVQANMLWLDRAVLMESRFRLFLWLGVSIAALLIVKGITAALNRSAENRAVVLLENPLTIIVCVLLIVVVRGLRIHTDVAPLNRIDTIDGLPFIIQLLARPWLFYGVVIIVTTALGVLFWRAFRIAMADSPTAV